jgi:hypothetical protein
MSGSCSSETSINICQITRRHIPEYGNLQTFINLIVQLWIKAD